LKLSIIVPVYNEISTITELLKKVEDVEIGMNKEIIVVDDGSTDGTSRVLKECELAKSRSGASTSIFCYSKTNGGKGRAVRNGLSYASGDIILIQDADLELDPQEYPGLLAPILSGNALVVYGCRNYWRARGAGFPARLANLFLNVLTAFLYMYPIYDMETAYKVMKKEVTDRLVLKSSGFEMEPEITAKLLRMRYKICQVPVSYKPRSAALGKKINWKDGLRAVI